MVNSLKAIISDYGRDILQEPGRVNALLMDYAPGLSRERKLLVAALKGGVFKTLSDAEGGGAEVRRQAVTRCVRQLISDLWVTEEAALYTVNAVAEAMGIGAAAKSSEGASPARSRRESPKSAKTGADKRELIKGEYGGYKDGILRGCDVIGYKGLSSLKNVERIEIPDSVKTIRSKAFRNCFGLKSVKLPAGIENIGANVFDGCYSLRSVSIENNSGYGVSGKLLIDKRNKCLMRAFASEPAPVKLPDGLISVSDKAFERHETEAVIIPASVERLSCSAFYECFGLQRYTVDRRNRNFCDINGVLFSKDGRRLIAYPIGRKDGDYFLEDMTEEIGERAFSKAPHLRSVTFNSVIRTIGAAAFEYCKELYTVIMPMNIDVIGERAFQYCTGLENVMLSRNIKEIGDFAFCGCTMLRRISLPAMAERIGNSAFYGCEALSETVIQSGVKKIGERAFEGCSKELTVVIKNNPYAEQYCLAHNINYR